MSVADCVLMLLRGGSRATFKHFTFSTNIGTTPMNAIEMEAIAAELRLMQESESLEVGIVDKQLLTA